MNDSVAYGASQSSPSCSSQDTDQEIIQFKVGLSCKILLVHCNVLSFKNREPEFASKDLCFMEA